MPYVQADADALRKAIATGAVRVRYRDGREITYRSLPDMKAALRDIEGELAGTDMSLAARRSFVSHSRGT